MVAPERSEQKRVLVVDDDENIRLALTVRLAQSGYEVLTAVDGTSAISAAVNERPDLLLLDISMPAGNGIHVARSLRGMPDTSSIPIVFMTAKEKPEYLEAAMRCGAVGFLNKPFEENVLMPLVECALHDHA